MKYEQMWYVLKAQIMAIQPDDEDDRHWQYRSWCGTDMLALMASIEIQAALPAIGTGEDVEVVADGD